MASQNILATRDSHYGAINLRRLWCGKDKAMSIKNDSLDAAVSEAEKTADRSSVVDLLEIRKKRLKAALAAAHGLWKGRNDIPADGVEYQRMLRGDWDIDK
ncbi:hypothetical protein [Duganella qianjiadongensis]|uniref:Uncharacterized protein n=1 Tax=Duganella qianjiadongensis TaxID=2692176 RepID=A0ABW9VSY7_9BURK|nr:hypothetical protein [Duganella qianjiadongensis]MYM42194.1 hypothetical protein [Duganella qianjiadongensis]